MNNTAYLVTPTNLLNLFILASDREYFSNPVQVELLYSEISTHFTIVRDPKRGHTYPTKSAYLKADYQLSRRQRKGVA